MKPLAAVLFTVSLVVACNSRANAAASFVNSWIAHTSSGTSPINLTVSTTATAGDVLVAAVTAGNSTSTDPCPTIPAPSGWTVAGSPACTNTRNGVWFFTATAAGNDSVTFVASWSGGTNYVAARVVDVGGANSSSPVEQISTYTGASNPTSPWSAPNTANTTTNGDLLISVWQNNYAPATGLSGGTGTWTMLQQSGTNQAPNNTIAYQTQSTAGAYGAPGMTFTGTITSGQTASIAIKAAVAAGQTAYAFPKKRVGGTFTGNPFTPPTPPPSTATPPPIDTMAWWDGYAGVTDNRATTATQVNQYMDYCNGAGQTTGTGTPDVTACEHAYIYFRANAVFPCFSSSSCTGGNGGETSLPFHIGLTDNGSGLCPSAAKATTPFFAQNPAPYDWTNTDPTKNWFTFPTGQTVGSIAGIGIGDGYSGGTSYNVYLNMLSTSLQSYVNSVVQNCMTATGSAASGTKSNLNLYEGFFNDNSLGSGLMVMGGGPAGSYGYNQHKNYGNSTGSPFASFNCNGGLPSGVWSMTGPPCTGSQLSTSDFAQGKCYDSLADNDQCYVTFWNAIKHANGTAFLFNGNGSVWNTTLTMLNASHSSGGTAEEFIIGFCNNTNTYTTTTNPCFSHDDSHAGGGVWDTIDTCAKMGNETTGKHYFALSDAANTSGGTGEGSPQQSAAQQWNIRIHFATLDLCSDDAQPALMVSWTNFEESPVSGFSNVTDVWPMSFVRPFGRIGESFIADPLPSVCSDQQVYNYRGAGTPCTSGGSHDPVIAKTATGGTCSATPPKCVFAAAFNHMYTQATPDLTQWPGSWNYVSGNTVSDLGAGCIIVNTTGSAITLSSTNLAAWCSNYASTMHVLLPCSPNASYLNTSGSGSVYVMTSPTAVVCSGNTGQDASNGGAVDHSTLVTSILNETIPNGDAVFLTGS